MKYAVSIPPFTDPGAILRLATDAEEAGWDGVFLWDHLRWSPETRLDVHDPWVLLGAIASQTERVTLGTMVTPLSRRRPWIVAKEITTLDHLSGGRAVLGVGLGAPADADFGDFGDVSDDRGRAEILDDALSLVDKLLRGGPVVHAGPHFTVDSELLPVPVQQPRPPIWVAGVAPSRRPLARARQWDGFVPIGSPFLTPDQLVDYVGADAPAGWDLVAPWAPGVPGDEYADAGATWLIDSTWPGEEWYDEFAARIRSGPTAPPD